VIPRYIFYPPRYVRPSVSKIPSYVPGLRVKIKETVRVRLPTVALCFYQRNGPGICCWKGCLWVGVSDVRPPKVGKERKEKERKNIYVVPF